MTLKTNNTDKVLNESFSEEATGAAEAATDAVDIAVKGRSIIKANIWSKPHYTQCLPQEALLTKYFSSEASTELSFTAKSVSVKEVGSIKNWNFELRVQSGITGPIYSILGFQEINRLGL